MNRLVLGLSSLFFLMGCEMQTIQYRNAGVVNPSFTATSRLNAQTGKYEIAIKWQGLGYGSYDIYRKTIESDPFNYGGGGIKVTASGKVHTYG